MKTTAAIFAAYLAVALADDGGQGSDDGSTGTKSCYPANEAVKAAGKYDVNANFWNLRQAGPNPKLCIAGGSAGFSTSWSFAQQNPEVDNVVKAYPNVRAEKFDRKLVKDITSIKSSTQWSYTTPNPIQADVAYDIFTSANESNVDYAGDFEFMIWLGRYGEPNPIGAPITNFTDRSGQLWEFWSGNITVEAGPQHTFSFLPKKNITNWDGDIKEFIDFTASDKADPKYKFDPGNQHLINVQFGTEPWWGKDAELQVHQWSADVA